MRAKISALMDGELGAPEFDEPLAALREEGEALEAWRTYHLISDALHGPTLLAGGCRGKVVARLAQEPTLLGPLPSDVMPAAGGGRWFVPSALAAGIAAVVLVGWIAFAPQQPLTPAVPIALAPTPVKPTIAEVKAPAPLPFNAETRDYLLAHQAYSPRNSLQGMATYVRSVSADVPPGNP
jgi:sigma-E factor negative regulatory protein RseA